MTWSIGRISKRHDRVSFDCGDASLNEYLSKYARQNDEKGITRTWVAVRPGETRVMGYVSLRTGHVEFTDLPMDERRKLPRYPVPVVHIARLAVDRDAQGQGLGGCLLVRALRIARAVSEEIGVRAVEVIATTRAAREFYRRFGFQGLPRDELHLYLGMKVVKSG
ncbi:MAG: GNAT family N-acetyltransferase [Planctomycetota bacterium]